MPRTMMIMLLSCVVAVVCSGVLAAARTLEQELSAVDGLRSGFDTPFEEVERRCSDLLRRYTSPEDQAKIYFQLAQVEGQSGMQRPEKLVSYVKTALQLPLEPTKQVRLYIYWGDTVQIGRPGVRNGEPLATRRKAAMPYLQGLRLTLAYDLTEERPDLPGYSGRRRFRPTDPEEYKESIRRQQQEYLEARRAAEVRQRMFRHRDILTSQISDMYSRFPFATDELRGLARKVLEDEAAVERLMSRVESRVQERLAEMARDVLGQVEIDVGLLDIGGAISEEEDEGPVAGDATQTPATPPVPIAQYDHRVPMGRYSGSAAVWLGGVGAIVLAAAVLLVMRRSRRSAAQ